MILNSIQTFLSNLFSSIGWDYIFFIGLGFEVLLAIFFIIKSSFSYEMRMVRKLLKLNNWLNKNQYVNSNNLIEFNNLMKRTPKLLRYHWHQYMLNRDKDPSFYMSPNNLIEKPMKTSSFLANIKNYIALSCAFGGLFLFWGVTGLLGSDLTFTYLSKCLATPFVMLFIAVLFVSIMRGRQNTNLSAFYQYFHYFNRFMDKAVTTMPEYVDFEVLFTRKEIQKGIPVLNEYLEKRARQEQEELEKARLNAIEHENFDFSETGVNGVLVLERAMKETETYLNIRTRLLNEIQQLDDEIDSLKRNYENTQKDYQKKMQVSKENIDRLRKQQEETTNRIENNYIKKQQSDEIKKQEQLEKDNDSATLRFNQEIETLTTEIETRRKELEEKRLYVEKAMASEYQSFSSKMYKSLSTIADEKNQAEKDELNRMKDEIAVELDVAHQQISEKDSEINELRNIIATNGIIAGENGGFYSKKLEKEKKKVKRGKKNQQLDEQRDADLIAMAEDGVYAQETYQEQPYIEEPYVQEQYQEQPQYAEEQPLEQPTENFINQPYQENVVEPYAEQPYVEEQYQEQPQEFVQEAQPEQIGEQYNDQQTGEEEYREYGEDGGWFDKDGYYCYENGAYFDPEGRYFDEFGGWYEADGVTYHEPENVPEPYSEPIVNAPVQPTEDLLDPRTDEEYREYGGDGGWFDKDGYYRYENGAYFDPEGRYFDEFGGWYEEDGITYHEPEDQTNANLARENPPEEPTNETFDDIIEENEIENQAASDFEDIYGVIEGEPVMSAIEEKPEVEEKPEEVKEGITKEDLPVPPPVRKPLSDKALAEIAKLKESFALDDKIFLDENDKPIEVELDENGAYYDSEGNYVYPNKGWYDPQGNFHDEKGGWYDVVNSEYHAPKKNEFEEDDSDGFGMIEEDPTENNEDENEITTENVEPTEDIEEITPEPTTDEFKFDEEPEEFKFEDEEPEKAEEEFKFDEEPAELVGEIKPEEISEQPEEELAVVEPLKRKAGRPRKIVDETEEKPKRKAGRPRKIKEEPTEDTPKRKAGRPRKIVDETEEKPKRKAGRPRKIIDDSEEKPKKAGRPKKQVEEKPVKKGRGRPKKLESDVKEKTITTKKKPGRPKKDLSQAKASVKKGRGRPKKANIATQTLTEKRKPGRPKKEEITSEKKGRGRPKKSNLTDLEKLNKKIEDENKKLAKHQAQLSKQLDETLSQLSKKNSKKK